MNPSLLPSDFPAPWASGWGQDRYGLWQSFTVNEVTQVLRWIMPGTFTMGSPRQDTDSLGGDETRHEVTLSHGFWLADTACTQALWRVVLGETPSRFKGDALPVERVSMQDVVERFLPALNRLIPGLEAGLPTEAQWEYTCRAGTQKPFSFGEMITTDQVNFNGNIRYTGGEKGEYRERTVDVKALPANDWGIYQMHGNVWEWCADWLGDYPREALTDPVGPPEGSARVLRGGSWIDVSGYCRSAYRYSREPDHHYDSIGFRLAREFPPRQAAGVSVVGGGAPASSPDSPQRPKRIATTVQAVWGKGKPVP